ncbi:signal transduction histidine kinase [Spongiibacter sp. IMCC21906]|uniref:ATP-binding protein n=1 Tax=Spongiibacter sp. IMCC21906 TaxID=1620392 RepID=UPI00062DCA92|nr:ATP-binding protein [Spongiibacter sp. IMCC21906]AKH69512.1 signal transduction histidine kinase [Spongiibacter sp. IMCC21906]
MRKRLGIKKLILLMGLLPTLGISLTLGSFLVFNQLQDAKTAVVERANHSSQQLAILSAQFLKPLNKEALQKLVTAALEERGLRNVVIFDSEKQQIVQAGPASSGLKDLNSSPASLDPQIIFNEDGLKIITPINSAAQPVGWLCTSFSWHHYEVNKYQTFLAGIIFFVIALLLSVALVSYITQILRSDFDALKSILKQLINGNKSFQAHLSGDDEFSEIADLLNQLSTAQQQELQELQRNIEQSNSDLRETLETLEIQNIELDLARREAVNANRIKSEFLANTSHEIRTPLNGIIGFTKILLKSELEQQQYDAVETIRKSSDGLLTIINDILDFSKMEAGKLVFDEAPVDIREIIEDTLQILAPTAFDKKLELALFFDPSIPDMLLSDGLRLKQILSNLLNNAIKFTASGYIRIDAICKGNDGQNISLNLQISDTGIGLSKDQQQQLFQGFTQADASITRQYGGTGLGLVIVKGLVEQMGGEIGVISEAGKGATFWVTLRLPVVKNAIRMRNFASLTGKTVAMYDKSVLQTAATQQLLQSWGMNVYPCDDIQNLRQNCDYRILSVAIDESLPTLPIPKNSEHPTIVLSPQPQKYDNRINAIFLQKPVSQIKLFDAFNLQHSQHITAPQLKFPDMRVLAVDDNPANLLMLKSFLDDLSVQSQTAQNGIEALQRCREKVFDLILMDIQMPQLDGIQASKEIRHSSLNKHTPIIALSAYLAPENPKQLREAGINDFLSKPIDDRQLLRLFERTASNPPAVSKTPPRPVDIQECLRLAKGKNGLAEEMLRMLLESLPDQAQSLAEAKNNDNRQQIAAISHDLKGACCYTGAPALKATNLTLAKMLESSEVDLSAAVDAVLTEIAALLSWKDNHDLSVIFAA